MKTIRPAMIERINTQFDQTAFSRHMFEVSADSEDTILRVKFLGREGYEIIISESSYPSHNMYKYVTSESPGQVSNEPEEFEHENLNNAYNRIHGWAKRIEEDYRLAIPGDQEFESFRKEFLDSINFGKVDSSHFSNEEQESMSERMDTLEQKLEQLYEEKEASHQQINGMREQIEILRKSVEILDKRTWLSAACNRIFDIYKEVKAAKNEVSLLLGDVNNLLSDLSDTEATETNESTE